MFKYVNKVFSFGNSKLFITKILFPIGKVIEAMFFFVSVKFC